MSLPPDFTRFATAFQYARYDEALALIDQLISVHPHAAALYWHRANCLEKLERYGDIAPVLDQLLKLKPDHVPAIVKRAQYDGDAGEAELRRALTLDPNHVEAMSLLSSTLRHRDDGDTHRAEADALLDRAIELAPMRVDLLEARATLRRSAATRYDDGPDDADTLKSWSGLRYSRSRLEDALDDYATCHALSGEYRYAVRMGMILHDLGRHDEALARYDEALAAMPPDDPKREFIVETRAKSENGGAGEREQMARLIESGLIGDGGNRSMNEDVAAQALLAAANAIRAGKSVQEAIETHVSDDPDTLMATNIAQQILNVAHEPAPRLEVVDAAAYPAYQRKFADAAARDIGALGMRHVGDAEARGMFLTLGQHVLLRFFADESGEIGVASFAMKPKWPGLIGFLFLLLSGKWKVQTMVECVSQFDDGTHLSTQLDSPSPFEYGGCIDIERLPRKTSIRNLVARHIERVAEFKRAHPTNVAMVADDIEGMDLRWREGQRVKRDYRASIGYITENELKRLLGAHHARFGDKVKTQLAMLAEDLADRA